VTFLYTDPDADPVPARDPALFVNDLQDANKKYFFLNVSMLISFEDTFTSFFEEKKVIKQ
jgi:hypothetical protein